MTGIPPARRGEIAIEVTFRVDTNGILRVRARDAATGAAREAAVNVRGGMSDVEVAEAVERQKSQESPIDDSTLPELAELEGLEELKN